MKALCLFSIFFYAYCRIRCVLTLIQHTQILIEKIAMKSEVSEDAVLLMELAKSILRLALYFKSDQPLLLDGGVYSLTGAVEKMVTKQQKPQTSAQFSCTTSNEQIFVGKRKGRKFRYISQGCVVEQCTMEGCMEPSSSQMSRERVVVIGEVCHIIRPTVYAYCNRRWRKTHPWAPFLASLVIDFIGHKCTMQGVDERSLNWVQRQELGRRKLLWFLYLLRSPLFDASTLRAATSLKDSVSRIPLLRSILAYALSMLVYVQRHHFYIAGS